MAKAEQIDGKWLVHDTIKTKSYMLELKANDLKDYIDLIVKRAQDRGMAYEGHFVFDYDDFYDEPILLYYFYRLETEEEKAKREAIEAKAKEDKARERKNKKYKEYKEYLRLKEKFEGKS